MARRLRCRRHVWRVLAGCLVFAAAIAGSAWAQQGRPPGARIALSPSPGVYPVNGEYFVTTVVRDANGPVQGARVVFSQRGAFQVDAVTSTDERGETAIGGSGADEPGTTVVTVCWDLDQDSNCDPGEPTATATQFWVEGNTRGCTLLTEGVVHPDGPEGDERARFAGFAYAGGNRVFGTQYFSDVSRSTPESGRVAPFEFVSTRLDQLVCGPRNATVLGRGRVRGLRGGVLEGQTLDVEFQISVERSELVGRRYTIHLEDGEDFSYDEGPLRLLEGAVYINR